MNTETDANKTPQEIPTEEHPTKAHLQDSTLTGDVHDCLQRRHFHKIQLAYRCINVLNMVIAISLLLLLKTNRIHAQYAYLILALLPLDLYVFSWIFHKIVIWKDPDKTGLPGDCICLGFRSPLIIWFFVDTLFVLFPMLFSSFQCIQGEKHLVLTTIAIFAVLFFVSIWFVPGHSKKQSRK